MSLGPLALKLPFASLEDEVRFLRGLVAVQRLADEVLEDCVEKQLGLAAAADVFLSQCARMIHAKGGFVQILGTEGPVLTRTFGAERLDVTRWSQANGPITLDKNRTAFVQPLKIGSTRLGALGFVLPGHFDDGGPQVQALVETVAETFDSAVLNFLALSEGKAPLERLDELSVSSQFGAQARIGKYELLQPLGTGGMAQVMVARTIGPGGVSRLVALKRILPKLADEKAIVDQFLDEAKLGMRMSHPNLITVYDFGQEGSTFYIAMELVKGVDFDHVIGWHYGPLQPSLVSSILVHALNGLHAAHEVKGDDGLSLGLVHRDLSPHNLMVGFDGRTKVLDFGVAKMRDQRTVTLPGIAKGKPLYMSPEQAVAERVDRRSDLFSMGLILYEALMGVRAFDTGDDTATMEAIVNDALAKPVGMVEEFWPVIETALQKDPNLRYRTALDMAQAIADAVPPMKDAEVAALLTERFPRRVAEIAQWELIKSQLSNKGVKKVKAP